MTKIIKDFYSAGIPMFKGAIEKFISENLKKII